MATERISTERLDCVRRTYHFDQNKNESGSYLTITEVRHGRRSSINVAMEDLNAFTNKLPKGGS